MCDGRYGNFRYCFRKVGSTYGLEKTIYNNMVQAFHMIPETKEMNDFRLRDGVDTCCHKT